VAALLQPQVVVGADPGEHGDLFAPQPGDAAHPGDRQPDALGLDQLPAGPQVVTEHVLLAHLTYGNHRGQVAPVPATPRIVGGLSLSLPGPAGGPRGAGTSPPRRCSARA